MRRVNSAALGFEIDTVLYALAESCGTNPFTIHYTTLQIQITQRPIQRAHHIANSSRLSSIAHINDIVETSLPRRWLVGPSHVAVFAAVHLVFLEATTAEVEQLPVSVVRTYTLLAHSFGGVDHLPRSPQTVHLTMVDPKRRIRGRSE